MCGVTSALDLGIENPSLSGLCLPWVAHMWYVWCRMCSWYQEPIFEWVVSALGCTRGMCGVACALGIENPSFECVVSVLSGMHVVCVVSHALLASRTHL